MSNATKELEVTVTERGFDLVRFTDYYGAQCTLQKSSMYEPDCIWLGLSDADPKILAKDAPDLGVVTEETKGWVAYPLPEEVLLNTRMHLTQSMAAKLLPFLQHFVETGELI